MSIFAAVGQAHATDPREAGMRAANLALNQLGNSVPALGIVISPYRLDAQLVINGVTSLLANVPLIGFSTFAGLTNDGQTSQGVVVALLSGENLQAETHWFSGYSQSSSEAALRLKQLLGYEQKPAQGILAFGDGLNGNAEEFCNALSASIPLVGGLASADPQSHQSYQIAGAQTGNGAMATAFLRGDFKMGIGSAHGWEPIGAHFRVTRSRGFWLRTLDGKPASETYAQLFGHPAREWAFPPLNYTTRIYPLGFEQTDTDDLLIRSPLRIEADGSFRMNASIRDGSDGYLMMGSPNNCEQAARTAASQALASLGNSKPVFALVLADLAWAMLLQANPGAEIQAIREVLGKDVKIAGGYTIGQITPASLNSEHPQFLNQHILVIAFSAPDEEE